MIHRHSGCTASRVQRHELRHSNRDNITLSSSSSLRHEAALATFPNSRWSQRLYKSAPRGVVWTHLRVLFTWHQLKSTEIVSFVIRFQSSRYRIATAVNFDFTGSNKFFFKKWRDILFGMDPRIICIVMVMTYAGVVEASAFYDVSKIVLLSSVFVVCCSLFRVHHWTRVDFGTQSEGVILCLEKLGCSLSKLTMFSVVCLAEGSYVRIVHIVWIFWMHVGVYMYLTCIPLRMLR